MGCGMSTDRTVYRCINDRYDPNGARYTLREFRAMCRACFGEAPELHREFFFLGGGYRDASGAMVLVVAGGEE